MKKGVKRPLKWFLKHLDERKIGDRSVLDIYAQFLKPELKRGTKSWENGICEIVGRSKLLDDEKYSRNDLEKYQKAFFLNSQMAFIRKGLLIEIGRCYITAYYYGITKHHFKMMEWLYNSFKAHQKMDIKFPHLEYARVFKTIRQNYEYYYHNDAELKLLIIKNLFKQKAEKLLPEKTDKHKLLDSLLERGKKKWFGSSKQTLIKVINWKDDYIEHLQDILINYGIEFEDEVEFNKIRNDMIKELDEIYLNERNEYDANVKFTIEKHSNKLLK